MARGGLAQPVRAGVNPALSRFYLPGMKQRNWGRILFISSERGVQIPPEMIHYGMTKAAQIAIARGLAESVAGTVITVNSILPGPTRSRGVLDFVGRIAKEKGKTFWLQSVADTGDLDLQLM
jgi:NAD(P)-dependent dehydrogenase (short-subunit alcohol dehydrogenase family)